MRRTFEVEFLRKLQKAVEVIRTQMLMSKMRREDVCLMVRETAETPRHHCEEPQMRLNKEEVAFFMKSHRRSFESSTTQQARRQHDKYVLKLSARQIKQRQDSRFNGLMKHNFGGAKCLQAYLQDGTFVDRKLPPLVDMPERDEILVSRYTNKRNVRRQALSKRKYYEGLVADLADPSSERAQKRTTLRFSKIQKAMEKARLGERFFYEPSWKQQEGAESAGAQGSAGSDAVDPANAGDKGQGKGKLAQQYIHYGLLQAGLEVPNAVQPPSHRRPGQSWDQWREDWQGGQGWQWHGGQWHGGQWHGGQGWQGKGWRR